MHGDTSIAWPSRLSQTTQTSPRKPSGEDVAAAPPAQHGRVALAAANRVPRRRNELDITQKMKLTNLEGIPSMTPEDKNALYSLLLFGMVPAIVMRVLGVGVGWLIWS